MSSRKTTRFDNPESDKAVAVALSNESDDAVFVSHDSVSSEVKELFNQYKKKTPKDLEKLPGILSLMAPKFYELFLTNLTLLKKDKDAIESSVKLLKSDKAKVEVFKKVLHDNQSVLSELDALCSYWKKVRDNRKLPMLNKYNTMTLEQQMGELNTALETLKKDNTMAMQLLS